MAQQHRNRVQFLRFWKTRDDGSPIADRAEIIRSYAARRWTTFTAITLGYSFFYFTRLTLSVANKSMIDGGVINVGELGYVTGALTLTYAFGRLTNGFLCDRAHIGRFMGTGLLVSAGINIAFGFSTGFWLFLLLWAMNGWFQSMGSAPSGANLANWFSRSERGTRYSIWSMAHNLGEGMTFVVTAAVVQAWGWQSGFWLPGCICIFVALVLFVTIQDRPQTYGLPPISEFKPEENDRIDDAEASVGSMQLQVLTNPAIWVLGMASACLYVARYGINNWFILFLQQVKGYDLEDAAWTTAFSPIIGAVGTLAAGPASDYVFAGRRLPVALINAFLLVAGLVAIHLIPAGHPWADRAAISVCGFAVGGNLVFLGGLMAIDLSSRKAAGAAMGIIGMFSYLAAAVGDLINGLVLEADKVGTGDAAVYHWDRVIYFWIGAACLSMLLVASLGLFRHPRRSSAGR